MSLQRDTIYNPRSSYNEQCEVDATQLCRICAECSDDLVSIFSKNGVKMDLINKIHTHLPIEVTLNDVLPLACCEHCIEKLNACHELVNRCLEADWKLRTLLNGDKHLAEYSRGDQNGLEELDRRASLSSTILARHSLARIDNHSMHVSKTYAKRIVKGLKRKSPSPDKVDTLQEDEHPNMSEARDKHIPYSAHSPEVEEEDFFKTYMAKRKCSKIALPDKEKPLDELPINQKQKETQKYKVVLVRLKNSASLSKALQVEEALKIIKTKQEAGDLPEAKGPVPKRLQKKLQGLKTYGLLKPNKYIQLPLGPRDFQTEDTCEMLTAPPRNTDDFICPSCEQVFMDVDALNSHVASSHKDLLFCYCSQSFKTQNQLNEHLELHVSDEIDSEVSNSRVKEEIESKPPKSRVTEEIESKPWKSRVTEELESKPWKSRVTEEIESQPLKSRVTKKIESQPLKSRGKEELESKPWKSRVTEEIESQPLKSRGKEEIESQPWKARVTEEIESKPWNSRVTEEIESQLIEFHVKEEISEPSKTPPTEISHRLTSQIVPILSEQTQRLWTKKLGDTLPNSNVGSDLDKSVDISITSSRLTKERISHDDQCENATKLVGDSRRSLNTGESGNDPSISFESGMLVDRKYIDLTEGNTNGIDIKCESHVAFSSLNESRVLMDSIIASVPKTKTKIWRCPMCGLVYPGEDRWLKHCDGIDFRCHFCEVVLSSLLEQKQHETEHLKSNHIMQ